MITPGVSAPPDLDLFDMDEADHARNRAYCEEIAAQILAAEMDPRNFFRRPGKGGYNLGHESSFGPSVRAGGVRALR
jgi:hypothetical protein